MRRNKYIGALLIGGGVISVCGFVWWLAVSMTLSGLAYDPGDSSPESISRILGFRDAAQATFTYGVSLLTVGLIIGAIKHRAQP